MFVTWGKKENWVFYDLAHIFPDLEVDAFVFRLFSGGKTWRLLFLFLFFLCIRTEEENHYAPSDVMLSPLGTFFWLWKQTVVGQFCQIKKQTSISNQLLSTLFRLWREKTIRTDSFVYILDRSSCLLHSLGTNVLNFLFPSGIKHTSDVLCLVNLLASTCRPLPQDRTFCFLFIWCHRGCLYRPVTVRKVRARLSCTYRCT